MRAAPFSLKHREEEPIDVEARSATPPTCQCAALAWRLHRRDRRWQRHA